MIQGHGNDLYKYKNITADFSSNVWHEGPSAELIKHIQNNVASIGNYPEPDAQSFANKAASFFKLDNGNCIATNGSVEGFYMIAQALKQQNSTIVTPAFAEYQDACSRYNYKVHFLNNNNLTHKQKFTSHLVWLGNPNNPDGKVFTISTIEHWLKNNTNTTFIIDEAYAELCTNFESAIPLIKKYNNLIVVKSFTKAFAIPGIRLGIILSSKSILHKIQNYQMPWAVNSLALHAGDFILQNYHSLLLNKKQIETHSKNLQQAISKIDGFKVSSSNCNYFLAQTTNGKASELKEYLAKVHGILIRDASNFQGLTPHHFRVAFQSELKNMQLINALKQWK